MKRTFVGIFFVLMLLVLLASQVVATYTVSQDGSSLTVQATDNAIYEKGYYLLETGAWTPFTIQASAAKLGVWLFDAGTGTVSLGDYTGRVHTAVYMCTAVQGDWDCHFGWQLQTHFIDSTTGPECGNNVIEGDEECDTDSYGGETCQSQGFDGGTLWCNSCTIATNNCYHDNNNGNDGFGTVPGCNVNSAPWPGSGWHDSYSANGKCYCDSSNFDHGIGDYYYKFTVTRNGQSVELNEKIRDICGKVNQGAPGRGGNPIYNDIQCGNGPPNNAGDENPNQCPGRVDLNGRDGCCTHGPRWDLQSAYGY